MAALAESVYKYQPSIYEEYTIGPTGCDYADFATAQAAQAQDLTALGKSIIFTFAEGTHNSGMIDYSGSWVTSATHQIILRGAAKHDGRWNDGDMSGGGARLHINSQRFRIVSSDAVNICFHDLKLSGGTLWGLISMGQMEPGSTMQLSDVFIYSPAANPFLIGCSSGSLLTFNAYNTVVISPCPCYIGYDTVTSKWYNCILVNTADVADSVDDYSGTFYNCMVSGSTTGVTKHNYLPSTITDTDTWADPSNPVFDFTPVDGGDAIGQGNNSYDYPEKDMSGNVRPSSGFNIGAIQAMVEGTGGGNFIPPVRWTSALLPAWADGFDQW